jgi:hypothetical protein
MGWKAVLLLLGRELIQFVWESPKLCLLGGFLLFVAFLMLVCGRFLDSLVVGCIGAGCFAVWEALDAQKNSP